MNHLPTLITDLALILGAAGIITLLFRRLKQPVVLGYIIAGLLVGPNFKLLPTITDIEGIKIWGEIGVIVLLFSLGLEFSFKKLVSVGPSAAATGLIELVCMMLVGFFTGKILGWPQMDCLFLGGIIAISSTTIIFRAFSELGLKTKQFTNLVMGILVIEDLVAVLLLVLLSTLAVSQASAGTEMLIALVKLGFFLCLWFIMGIYILPSFLKLVSKWLRSETLLIISLALCLGMVVLATNVGFSAALGAFIMGSILSETLYGEKIEHLIAPVKNLFGAIFFVSVGMLIEPRMLAVYWVPVVAVTLIVIIGKTIFVSLGALVAGKPLQKAVQAGTAMSQIGEFSFIIAALGVSLKVTSNYLYPVAVGVSVITTFTTPYMMRLADPLYLFLLKKLPPKWLAAINRYSTGSQTIKAESDWAKVFKAYLQIIVVNTVVIIAIIGLGTYYLKPFIAGYFDNAFVAKMVALLITLSASMPFIWALMAKKIHGIAYRALWLDRKYNHGPLVALEIARNIIGTALVGFSILQFFPFWASMAGTLGVMGIALVMFRQRLQQFYGRIEKRFINNLNAKENAAKPLPKSLTPWDAHLSAFSISPSCDFIGKTLVQLSLREKYGINIGYIQRGSRMIYAPARDEKLYPHDEIGVIGTDAQLQLFGKLVEVANEDIVNETDREDIQLERIVVDVHNALKGKSIRASGIRENTHGLVVGIERNGERLLNPSSNEVFEWDDVVWLVGNHKKIQQVLKEGDA